MDYDGHSRQKTLGNPVCKRLPRNRPCVHVVSVFRNARPMSVQMEKNDEPVQGLVVEGGSSVGDDH